MDTMTGMLLIVAACAAVLIISVMRRKAAFLLRFLVRMIIGAFAIMATNSALATAGLSVFVGLNVWSLLTVGTLGIGGFGMLYAILLYMNL